MQELNFGQVRDLVVRDGEPVFDPPPSETTTGNGRSSPSIPHAPIVGSRTSWVRDGFQSSPCATLFIILLVLQLLTEDLQYQRLIKEHAVPCESDAASGHIS